MLYLLTGGGAMQPLKSCRKNSPLYGWRQGPYLLGLALAMASYPLSAASIVDHLPQERGSRPTVFAYEYASTDTAQHSAESLAALLQQSGFPGFAEDFVSTAALRESLLTADRHALKLQALWFEINVDDGAGALMPLRDAIPLLKGRDTVLWMAFASRSHQLPTRETDSALLAVLREAADLARANSLRVALYPHAGFYIERVEDAMRIANRLDRRNVGVTFNLCHWLKTDGRDLDATLRLAMPRLFLVTINGADSDGTDWGTLIQTLDRGTYDVGLVVGRLAELGYKGPIGIQHWGIRGDVHDTLRHSMAGWRSIADRAIGGTR